MTHSRPTIRELLDSASLAPRRDLGQNFVADPNTVRRIAELAHVGAGDRVVEIGAGLGSLTLALADTGAGSGVGASTTGSRPATARLGDVELFPEVFAHHSAGNATSVSTVTAMMRRRSVSLSAIVGR